MKKTYSLRWKKAIGAFFISTALVISQFVSAQAPSNGLKLHYTFETAPSGIVPDASGNGYDGTLNSATIGVADGRNVLIFDNSNTNYLDMNCGSLVASLDTAYCIEMYVYFDQAADLTQYGYQYWNFSNSLAQATDANGCLFYEAKRDRVAISPTNYNNEQAVQTGIAIEKGRWVHLAYSQSGTKGVLYHDGFPVATATVTMLPNALGTTLYNSIGRPVYTGDKFLNSAKVSDFRIYNRSLSRSEIENSAYPSVLITSSNSLLNGVLLDQVTNNLTLPTSDGDVSIVWSSSNISVIANDGTVTRPTLGNSVVKLSAIATYTTGGITYTRKRTFDVTVLGEGVLPEVLAKWDFASANIFVDNGEIKVNDVSGSNFVGTCKNEASIRTIGKTTQFQVLDLGEGSGYFDMGTPIGDYIYKLNQNFTIGIYYRINKAYTKIDWWGNCLWNFANSGKIVANADGGMFISLKYQGYVITPTYWSGGEDGPKVNVNAPKDVWKHIAFVQDGDTGRIYDDGELKLSTKMIWFPSTTLAKDGKTGTVWNTIGYPAYDPDSYLQKTLVYGFEMRSYTMTGDDIKDVLGMNVTSTLADLNAAYAEDSLVSQQSLVDEFDALTLGDLSGVTANLTLPTQGATDHNVKITWKSSAGVVSNSGVVTRPDYMDQVFTLTAQLTLNGELRTKSFSGKVLKNSGTGYTGDLLISYDFDPANVSGSTVTDASEKHFTGTLMKGASALTIGPAGNRQNVLSLYTDTSYFDMGTECGKVIYGLNDYSISVYFVCDETKTNLSNNGNFLYAFSNSAKSEVDMNGYMFGRASNAIHCVSSQYWAAGNMQTLDRYAAPTLGVFHHFVYTQKGTVGTSYLDGDTIVNSTGNLSSIAFTNTPSASIPKPGMIGTIANFLGRPNFSSDTYLAKAMIADFKLYGKVLTGTEVKAMQTKTTDLTDAYTVWSGVPVATVSKLRVNTTVPGLIQILDLNGTEKVAVYNVMGQSIRVNNPREISVKPGIYIVRVNEKTAKVFVQ